MWLPQGGALKIENLQFTQYSIRVDGGIMRQHLLWDSLSFTCLIKLKETYLDYCSFAQRRCPLITSKNF